MQRKGWRDRTTHGHTERMSRINEETKEQSPNHKAEKEPTIQEGFQRQGNQAGRCPKHRRQTRRHLETDPEPVGRRTKSNRGRLRIMRPSTRIRQRVRRVRGAGVGAAGLRNNGGGPTPTCRRINLSTRRHGAPSGKTKSKGNNK